MKNMVVIAFLAVFAVSCNLITVNTSDTQQQVFQKQIAKVRDVKFSPDGKFLMALGFYTPIYVWRVTDFSLYAKYKLIHEEPDPFSADIKFIGIFNSGFTSDSKYIYAAINDGRAVLINLESGEKTTYDFGEHSVSSVRSTISHSGRILAMGSKYLDTADNRMINLGLYTRGGVAITRDDKYLIAGNSRHSSLDIVELATGKKVSWKPHSPYFTPTISGCDVSPDNDTIAVGLRTGDVRLYSIRQAGETGNLPQGEYDARPRFSPDGKLLMTTSSNDKITLWDVATRTRKSTWKKDGLTNTITWLRGTHWFAIGTSDGKLIVESTENKKTIFRMKVMEYPISDIDYLPAERLFVVCDIEGNISAFKIP